MTDFCGMVPRLRMLSLFVFLSFIVSVMGECSPSNAVVAVASVFTTLAVIFIVLAIIYFIIRKRQAMPKRARKVSGNIVEGLNDLVDGGFVNDAFSDQSDASRAEQGVVGPASKTSSPNKTVISPSKDAERKTWASLPSGSDSGLYRQGSCGSFNESALKPDNDIVSVCLESQDIIGLGFNISGSFNDGILVSQVHNRGPAVESGKIKVGDKILSVTVSYENIVFEDALTILSYASPYPVKITLQKANSLKPNGSTEGKRNSYFGPAASTDETGSSILTHPLFRSKSVDALKKINGGFKGQSSSPFQPKRTQSEVKPETRKENSNKKKGDRTSKNIVQDVFDKITGTLSSKSPQNKAEVVVSDVTVHNDQESEVVVKTNQSVEYSAPNVSTSEPEKGKSELTPTTEFNSEAISDFESFLNQRLELESNDFIDNNKPEMIIKAANHEEYTEATLMSPKTPPPNKPERKNRKSSSIDVNSFPSFDTSDVNLESEDIVVASEAVVVNSMPNVEFDDTVEIEEEIIVPSSMKREVKYGSNDIEMTILDIPAVESKKDLEGALEDFAAIELIEKSPHRTPSPDKEPVEEEEITVGVASKALAYVPKLDKEENTEGEVIQKTMEKETKLEKPVLDEAMLERLIAMNAYAPGTQGWAGIQAGGIHGGVVDDFVPNNQFCISQPSQVSGTDVQFDSPVVSSQTNVAFEIRDDFISGTPVIIENKRKSKTSKSPSNPFVLNENNSLISDLSVDTPANNTITANSIISKVDTNNQFNNNNEATRNTDFLILSNQTFSKTGSSLKMEDKDSEKNVDIKIDDLTDSDSDGLLVDLSKSSSVQIDVTDSLMLEGNNSGNIRPTMSSDVSESPSGSSGEGSPQSNDQELGSSPEFSLPNSPFDLVIRNIEPINDHGKLSVKLKQENDNNIDLDDMDC